MVDFIWFSNHTAKVYWGTLTQYLPLLAKFTDKCSYLSKKIKMAASAILIFSIKSIFSFLFKWLDSLNHCYSHFNFLHELELKVASISIFCVLWSRFLLRDRPNFGPDISFPSKKYSWDWKNENCFEIITKFYN